MVARSGLIRCGDAEEEIEFFRSDGKSFEETEVQTTFLRSKDSIGGKLVDPFTGSSGS